MVIIMCAELSVIIQLAGAHIGPEPTTDRFVVVMVCKTMSKLSSFKSDYMD